MKYLKISESSSFSAIVRNIKTGRIIPFKYKTEEEFENSLVSRGIKMGLLSLIARVVEHPKGRIKSYL